jgi:Type I phosphodiesterase / nucleotide pyrophosphatase
MQRTGTALLALLIMASMFLPSGLGVRASVGSQPPPGPPPGSPAALTARPKYVFVLVLDGGLPSYLRLGSFPHIASLVRQGTTYTSAWDGMLETETPTGHASLGTGTLPRRNGIIAFSWINDTGTRVQPTNPAPILQGQLEDILRSSGTPSLAAGLKQWDPSATMAVTSGHKDYAVDAVGGPNADYLMYYENRHNVWTPVAIPRHVPPQSVLTAPGSTAETLRMQPGDQDSLAVHLALSSFQQVHQRVTIVNLPEFDWPLGHLRGGPGDAAAAWQLTSRLDGDIGAIEAELAREHVLKDTLFVLTADHGMLTLRHRVSHNLIERAVSAAGTSLADYEYHSAGYLWLRNRGKAAAVARNIMNAHDPAIRTVYYQPAGSFSYRRTARAPGMLASSGSAYRFLLDTFAGPSSPQVVIVLRENAAVVGRNEHGWLGDHGGPSWNAEHIPLILSGPGVRVNVRLPYPAAIYDITPTILRLIGAQPVGMDGVVLSDCLTDPLESDTTTQQQRGSVLHPVVDALKRQSVQDGP